jgi:hypothetical protein
MTSRRQLPNREQVFIMSLMYHGFHLNYSRRNLKFKKGYMIPATKMEDSGGVDLWIKMPKDDRILPVQITQRGVRMYKMFRQRTGVDLQKFVELSKIRIRDKQQRCFNHGIAFVLVRDFVGNMTNPTLAWGDIKSLKYGIAHLRRHL